MKILFALLSLLLCQTPLRAEKADPSFLLLAPEGMDDALVERVQTWMSTNLYYEVRLRRLPAWPGVTAAEQVAALGVLEQPGIFTVVMSSALDEGKHAVVLPEQYIGFMNVGLLAPEVNETNLRRLDRQAIRIVGFGLGVPPQPIPFCALFPYQDMAQLDQIGRGFSPPAMAHYRAALEKKGIPLSVAAEQFLPKITVAPPPLPAPQLQE